MRGNNFSTYNPLVVVAKLSENIMHISTNFHDKLLAEKSIKETALITLNSCTAPCVKLKTSNNKFSQHFLFTLVKLEISV